SAKINLKKIDKSRVFKGKKGDYYEVQVIINDELDQFNNQISLKEALTKEERESGKQSQFLGNGSVYYVDGIDLPTTKSLLPAEPESAVESSNDSKDDLPF
ncbi:MAG: hypothetical protein ACTSUF_07985, partial [Candidatus Heimdallarchaeaceae archaeon]